MVFNIKSITFAGGLMLYASSLYGMQSVNPEEDVRISEIISMTTNNIQSELQRHKHSDFVRVLLIGVKGSGKTTLLHALAGANLFVERIGVERVGIENELFFSHTIITSDESKEIDSVKIKHTLGSEIGIPNLWSDLENKITYCDNFDFFDSTSYQQRILNAFSIDQLFSEPCAIKILLVISASEFMMAKGVTALRSFIKSAKLLRTREEFMQSVGLVITKIREDEDPRELLELLLTGTNEKVMEARPFVHFFLNNIDSRVFTFPKHSLAKGVKKQPYGLFEDRARMIDFFKTNPVINPSHSIILDESIRGMLLSINGLKHTDMQSHLKEFSDNIEKMYIDERDVDSLQEWIRVLQQLKDATSKGIGDFAGVLRSTPKFSGKFGAFLQQVDLFLPWQNFIKNFFDDETCLNVSEILDQKFDLQIQYLKETKTREELKQ